MKKIISKINVWSLYYRTEIVWFRKEPMLMYNDTLDVAITVIQDFVNCDPLDVGKLQANTYNTIFNIEKEINNED
jgi:hypothetical protein